MALIGGKKPTKNWPAPKKSAEQRKQEELYGRAAHTF